MTEQTQERPPLLADILNQPHALAAVANYHLDAAPELITQAAAVLRGARLIVLSGIGASLAACMPLAAMLARHGLPVVVADASEFLHYYLTSYRDAVVVLVSRSGESVELVQLAQEMKRRNTHVIAVTCEPNSTLAGFADPVLWVNSPPDDFVAIQSYAGTLLVLYLLGAGVIGQSRDDARTAVHQTRRALHELVEQFDARGADAFTFLQDANVIYLLGRGASLASAHQGALLLNEIAKLPSVAMSSGHFRHGPVEVVDTRFRAFIFAGSPPAHALNLALAQSLERAASGIRLIGPDLASENFPSWNLPGIAPFLLPMLEIVPIQFAAYHLARARDIPQGEFRFVSQVTRSEVAFAGSGLN